MDKESTQMTIELKCPVNTRVLRHIRCFIVQIVKEAGFDDKEVTQIEMSVDEACSNIVEHAYCEEKDTSQGKKIYLEIEMMRDRVKISVGDTGKGMLPQHIHREHNLQEYIISHKYRGLGTYIITNFMDDVLFHTENGRGTTIEMIKYRRNNHGISQSQQ